MSIPKGVAELLAERAKYTTWLDQLAARTAGAPPHVVAKVRDDYERRLAAVRDALGARAEELAEQQRQALARRDAAVAAERDVADARAEAELRHAVGEYSADEWVALARESDAAMATATADRLAAELALGDVEKALADVQGTAPGTAPAVPDAVDVPDAVAAAPAAPVERPAAPDAPSAPPVARVSAEAESVLDVRVEAEAEARAEADPDTAADADDEAEVPPTITATVERPAPAGLPALDDLFLAPVDDVAPPPAAPTRPSGAIRGTEAFDDLEFLKTLRVSGATPTVSRDEPAKAEAPPAVASSVPTAPQPLPPVAEAPPEDVLPVSSPPVSSPSVSNPSTSSGAPLPPPQIPGPPPPPRISREFAPPPMPITPDPTVLSPEAQLFAPRRTDPGVDAVRAGAITPSALRPSGSGTAAKSLKCAECGAMNYPTEWYCERCGGELASL